jgi:SAM-dependent methyltransferase
MPPMGQPPPWLWDLPLINLYSVDIIGFMYDVPFVATPEVVVRRMLQLARVRPGEVLYDLGSGDGRIVIAAAKEFGARAFGVEIRKDLYEQSTARIKDLGLSDKAAIINASFYEVPLTDADVITMYLLTTVNERLKPKLEKELRPATRVVTHDFEVPGWRPVVVEEVYEGVAEPQALPLQDPRQGDPHPRQGEVSRGQMAWAGGSAYRRGRLPRGDSH